MNTSRLASVVVVIVALLVTVHPAAAAHTVVVSSHTTEPEFDAGTLTNVSTSSGAVVYSPGDGSTVSREADSGTKGSNDQAKHGLRVNPNTDLEGLNVTLSSNTAGATTAYITETDGTVIGSASISGGEANISASLNAGTNYYVMVDAGGSSYTIGVDSFPSFPYTSDDVDITAGVEGISITTSTAYTIRTVEAWKVGGQNGTYISANHSGSRITTGFTNLTLTNTTATVTWEGTNGGSWNQVAQQTYTTDGNRTLDLSSGDYDTWRVNVTFVENGDSPSAKLFAEGIQFDSRKPSVNNSSASPSNGERVSSDPVTLSIDVSDGDFPTSQSDSLNVEYFGNGNSIGTSTLSSNGTATIDWSPTEIGNQEWDATITDDQGHTIQSDTFTFETPSNLTFRNETNASEIITGSNAQVTFFGVNGTVVVRKQDSNGDGNISLAGLPNQAFVVTISANGYHDRRVYIDSIYDQQNIYLLNSSVYPGIETTFVYEDRTGQFEQANTTLEVQRAVDVNNDSEFEWTTVAGDFWGAAGEFPFTGETQARYRLIITNQETGKQRILGTHIPTSDGIKNIIVGRIVFEAENATGRYVDAAINSNTSNLQILYNDPANSSTDVNIVVHEQGNTSNEIYNQTFTGPLGEKVVTQSLTENQTATNWVVKYDVGDTRDGPKFYKVVVGGGSFPLPISPDILSAFSYLFITFVMLLYGPRTALLGAWAGVIVFAGFAFLGWISGVTVAVPVLIAIGATFYNEASP